MDQPGSQPPAGQQLETAVRGRYLPGLEGLRGVAVAIVVLFHLLHVSAMSGGFLGVDLFFVLSGFLITTLLVEEHLANGSIALLAFWVRRAKRLLPALFTLIAVLTAVVVLHAWTAGPRSDALLNPHSWRVDALGAIYFVSNWVFLHSLEASRITSVTPHLWSLAVEEQFYLVWPLVTVGIFAIGGRHRRRLGIWLSLGLGVASSVATWLVFAEHHRDYTVYLSTPLHAGGLLGGATLAWLVAGRPQPGPKLRLWLGRGAVVAMAGIFAFVAVGGDAKGLHFQATWMNAWGWPLFVLLAVLVVADVRQVEPSPLARVLSWRPLRLLGLISYGLYIIHLCVFLLLTPERLHLGRWPAFAVQLVVSIALATLSYRYIEMPVRRSKLVDRKPWLVLVAFGAITAVVLVGTSSFVTGPAGEVPPTTEPAPYPGGKLPGAGDAAGSLRQPKASAPYALVLSGAAMAAQLAGPLEAATAGSGHAVEQALSVREDGEVNLATSLGYAAAHLHGADGYLVVATCESGDLAGSSAASRAPARQADAAAINGLLGNRDDVGLVLLGCPLVQPKAQQGNQAAFNELARAAALRHPGAVAYLPVQTGLSLMGHFAAFLPPAANPLAPYGQATWERVRMSDGVHYCQAGAIRVTAATLDDLASMGYELGPTGRWWRGSWLSSPAFARPGRCSNG